MSKERDKKISDRRRQKKKSGIPHAQFCFGIPPLTHPIPFNPFPSTSPTTVLESKVSDKKEEKKHNSGVHLTRTALNTAYGYHAFVKALPHLLHKHIQGAAETIHLDQADSIRPGLYVRRAHIAVELSDPFAVIKRVKGGSLIRLKGKGDYEIGYRTTTIFFDPNGRVIDSDNPGPVDFTPESIFTRFAAVVIALFSRRHECGRPSIHILPHTMNILLPTVVAPTGSGIPTDLQFPIHNFSTIFQYPSALTQFRNRQPTMDIGLLAVAFSNVTDGLGPGTPPLPIFFLDVGGNIHVKRLST